MALQEREDVGLPFPAAEQQAVSHPGIGAFLDTLLQMPVQGNRWIVRRSTEPVCLQGLTLGIYKLCSRSHGPSRHINCKGTGYAQCRLEGRS